MSVIKFENPTPSAIQHIADNMRQADVAEVKAFSGLTPHQALLKSYEISQYSVIVSANGVPCAMMGLVVANLLTGTGVPWLLATDDAMKHKRLFLTLSRHVIDNMRQKCPVLINYVHVKNRASVRWLKWLGFTFGPAQPMGADNDLFYKFSIGD